MEASQLDLLRTDELDIALRLSYLKHYHGGGAGAAGGGAGSAVDDKEARRKEKKKLKDLKVQKAKEAKKNAAAAPASKKDKFVGNSATATAEVDVNTPVELCSLVSSTDLPLREGEEQDKRERFYLTTAINYTNGEPHIGHAYEAITSDVLSRYQRMSGKRVIFQTGSDEHGQKIANTAAKLGLQPIDICDKYAGKFQELNKRLLISNDLYMRTTSALHKETSQRLWQICADAGDIFLGKYEGWYDEREEKYVTDSDAELADFKDAFGSPLKRMSEASYFFKMGKYIEWLIQYITDNPSFIQPETHRLNILTRLQNGHQNDLSVSRTTFKHGIPVPVGFDQAHVMYVWFDALTNYLSGIHALDSDNPMSAFWPASVHVIGKDITWFHCVIWPCILKSAGLPLPKTVYAHGFVAAADGRKMSKSLGNVIDPHDICDQYAVDTFRWYICREAIFGCDLSFSKRALVLAHNSELCNTFGNLVHRSLSLMHKYNNGNVPERQVGFDFFPFDFAATRRDVDAAMANYALQDACAVAMEALRETNKFLQESEPWMRKCDEDRPYRLECVRVCLEAVYCVNHLLVAFLPTACTRVFEKLGLPPVPIASLKPDFSNIPAGTKVTVGSILFGMLDLPDEVAAVPAAPGGAGEQLQTQKAAKPAAVAMANGGGSGGAGGGEAEGDPFSRIEIKVGRITKASPSSGRVWNHESKEHLYCEEIDVGEGEPRAIASGLREHCTPEEMQGRLVLVVCNLKPAKFAGFASNGMVLAAKSADGKVELVRPPEGSVVGERARVEGSEGEPLTPAQVKKKKAFEELAKHLRTDDDKVATYQGKPITTSGGACTADTVAGGELS
ncbi:unnamed protein product [Ectocarpus sp. 8 AP-2014]